MYLFSRECDIRVWMKELGLVRLKTMVERRVVHRKKIVNTGTIALFMGAVFTFAMVYTVNETKTILPNGFTHHNNIQDPRKSIDMKIPEPIGSDTKTESTGNFANQKTPESIGTIIKKRETIFDLVQKIDLVNVTKAWFTVFPFDDHMKSFLSYFKRRNTTITTLPKLNSLTPMINCKETKTKLLILVPSVVNDGKVRLVIRKTWASFVYDSDMSQRDIVKLVFVFGDSALKEDKKETLRSESEKFGDIVTIDMVDSYKNLSLKIASMLSWSSKKCPSAEFVAKVDMDTWINIPLLVKLLDQLTIFNRQNNISASTLGFRHAYNHPIAVHSGKWEIPISLYPYNFLPRYIYGHSYVLSRTAVDRVVSSFPFFPIIPNEDAFTTGIMSLVSNVTRVHSPAFAHLYKKQTYLDIQHNKYVSSIHSIKNLQEIWTQIKNHNATAQNIH